MPTEAGAASFPVVPGATMDGVRPVRESCFGCQVTGYGCPGLEAHCGRGQHCTRTMRDCWFTGKDGRHGGVCHLCGSDLVPAAAGMGPAPD